MVAKRVPMAKAYETNFAMPVQMAEKVTVGSMW